MGFISFNCWSELVVMLVLWQDSGQQAKGTSHEDDNTEHNKTGAKNGKQASDPGKEDYIHVRARRGQATNSHSLAERVRFFFFFLLCDSFYLFFPSFLYGKLIGVLLKYRWDERRSVNGWSFFRTLYPDATRSVILFSPFFFSGLKTFCYRNNSMQYRSLARRWC